MLNINNIRKCMYQFSITEGVKKPSVLICSVRAFADLTMEVVMTHPDDVQIGECGDLPVLLMNDLVIEGEVICPEDKAYFTRDSKVMAILEIGG